MMTNRPGWIIQIFLIRKKKEDGFTASLVELFG